MPRRDLRAAVFSLVSRWPADYGQRNWNAVRSNFQTAHHGQLLVLAMRMWKAEAVGALRTAIVFTQPAPGGNMIATVEFYSDPRAIPAYESYLFSATPGGARIVRPVTGLSGTTYRSTNWSVTRTAHFTIYHSPYDLRGSDAAAANGLEYERRQFIGKFGVGLAPRIIYYYYPEQRLMPQLTHGICGANPDNVGCALPDFQPPVIHASEWPSYHEPVHVYQRALVPPGKGGMEYVAPLFIGEGMAVALEDRELDPRYSDYCTTLRYTPLDTCARQVAPGVTALSLLNDKGFNHARPGDAYLLAGSFVKYLILHYGYRPFGRFYYDLAAQPKDRVQDYNVATEAVYHRTITALLNDWHANLCNGGC